MISVQDAKAIIHANTTASTVVISDLNDAFGLVTAAGINAVTDIPNFNQSSMDGYAIKFADKDNPLEIIGEMAAGASKQLTIKAGQAVRIFTGAPLPEGADTVVMQEKVTVKDNCIIIVDENLSPGLHVRLKGAEVKKNETAMPAGTYLSPAAIGFLAGIGCRHVTIYTPPKVAIILTGNELQQPGRPLSFGQVYEANSVQLTAALKKTGIRDITVLQAEDDPATVINILQQALEHHDIILLNGGVSVGDYDYVVKAAKACGVEEKFHKIKQKPGKPLYFGTQGKKLVFGLPGNPSSSLTCFYEYVLPALEKMTHLPDSLKISTATTTHNYDKPAGLTHFLKAFYTDGEVTPLHAQESFRLHSFAQANCFMVLPEASTGCRAGDEVEVHLLPI